MRCTGKGIGIAMLSAFTVLDSEIEAGQDLQPPQDHTGWGFQRADPGQRTVVRAEDERPVQEVILVILQEKDHCK